MEKNKIFLIHNLFFLFSVIFILVNNLSAMPEPKTNIEDSSTGLNEKIETKTRLETRLVKELPFKIGERLVYNVRYKGIKIGTSFLTFKGQREINGCKVYLVEFFTDTLYLKDRELIYAEKESFLPLRVERNIKKTPGFTTEIIEDYNQQEYKIDILKKGFMTQKKRSIVKSAPIHNAILISYYFRILDDIENIKDFKVNLPTEKFRLSYHGKEVVKTGLSKIIGFKFQGEPYSFNFWLSVDNKRTPLKIEDPGMFGYSLVLDRKENVYNQEKNQ